MTFGLTLAPLGFYTLRRTSPHLRVPLST